MTVLGIDLGTKTGYALASNGAIWDCGTWILSKSKEIAYARKLRLDRRCDPRFLSLFDRLMTIHSLKQLDYIVFEDVQFAVTVMASQLWSSLRSAIWMMSKQGVQIDCVPVGTLKKFATGSGASNKVSMAIALNKIDSRFTLDVFGEVRDTLTGEILTDDAVDAIWLAKWAIKNIKA